MIDRSSIKADHLKKIFRAIVSLDVAIDCVKTTTGCILDLRPPADKFILEMTAENRNCVQSLQRGFYKLTTTPLQAKENVRAAHNASYNIEEIYRNVSAGMVDHSETVKMPKHSRERLNGIADILLLLQRREAYHYLLKSAKRFRWAANHLQAIVSPSVPNESSVKKSIG